MSGLHFNYKDIFRSLRLGFSAKKVGMVMLGLLFAFTGYSLCAYIAHLVAGNDWLSIWETFRLLPFPRPDLPFPLISWVVYAIGGIWFLCTMLITGTAVAKVTYEQLRGNEFYGASSGFRFALRHAGAVITSPCLLIAFIGLIVIGGLILSALGAIPHFGQLFTGIFALPAFFAALFIVYLLIVLMFTLFLGPVIVGGMGNDTFDTLFEVFSAINEQPARLIWYTFLVGFLAKFGSFLLGLGSSLACRIGSLVVATFMGEKWLEMLTGAGFVFNVTIPNWGVLAPLHKMFVLEAKLYGIPWIYSPEPWFSPSWSTGIGAALLGIAGYAIGLMVIAYGLSVWFSGNLVSIATIIKKKDDKNIFAVPEEEEDIVEPAGTTEGKTEGEK